MRTLTKIAFFILMALALLALPATALAQAPGGDGKVVFGGTYQLNSGETLNGSLAVIGGEARLLQGSLVNGDVALSGGTLSIQGEVQGNIVVLGGTVFLEDTAVIHGDITTVGGSVNRSPNAKVEGSITSGPQNFTFPIPRQLPNLNLHIFDTVGSILWGIFQALALAAIAMVVAMLLPLQTQRVSASIMGQPVVAGGIGLLTAFIAPIVVLLMTITILLIPVALLSILALVLAVTYGWIALGLEVGQRMASSVFHTQWTLPVAAGIGTLTLSLVADLAAVVPCVGWLVPFVIAIVALGGVLASRFGTQIYTRPVPAVAAQPPYIPPAAPATPQSLPPTSEPPATTPDNNPPA